MDFVKIFACSHPSQLRVFVRFENSSLPRIGKMSNLAFAVVRQQFVLGINRSVFLYQNSFGASQCLALTRKSFRVAQVSHCAVQGV